MLLLLRPSKTTRDVAQLVSAPRSGRGGRTFESSHPDLFIFGFQKSRGVILYGSPLFFCPFDRQSKRAACCKLLQTLIYGGRIALFFFATKSSVSSPCISLYSFALGCEPSHFYRLIFLRKLDFAFCESNFPQAIGHRILREQFSLGNWLSHFARAIFLRQLGVAFCESDFP